jgi:hypothetical protein
MFCKEKNQLRRVGHQRNKDCDKDRVTAQTTRKVQRRIP